MAADAATLTERDAMWRNVINGLLVVAAIALSLRGATLVYDQPAVGLAHVLAAGAALAISAANGARTRR